MNLTRVGAVALAIGLALGGGLRAASAATISLSLNVFPTVVGNPDGGGTWRIVAKTDAPLGIASVSFYLKNVALAAASIESDINATSPFKTNVGGGQLNLLYGQDTTVPTILAGVGTPSFSDGPDPFGDPLWDGATRLFSGTYASLAPMFGPSAPIGNTLNSTVPNTAAAAAVISQVVRFAVPEPTTAIMLVGAVSLTGLRRRR